MVQVPKIHRDRLGVAEQEGRMRQQKQARKKHGAKGIDMLEGVEADPAELPGGVVPKPVRHKAVGGLVKGDGDEEGKHPDGELVERDVQSIARSVQMMG